MNQLPLLLNISHVTLHVAHDQFEQLCQDNPDLRLELTSTGQLITMPPTGWESSRQNGELFGQIWRWNLTHTGVVFDSSGGFTLRDGAVRSPDVSWVSISKLENVSTDVAFPRVVPDFVIELRSKTDNLKALQQKMWEYRNNGVRLGWLINIQQRQVEIYRLGQEVEILQSPTTLSGEDVLPGLVVDLSPIFRSK